MERALGHSREHFYEGVVALLLIHVGDLNDARSEFDEGSVQELVDEEDVADCVGEVDDLAGYVRQRVPGVRVDSLVQVLTDGRWAALAFVRVAHAEAAHAVRQVAHGAVLQLLPDPVRRVEQDSLQEKNERNPLVVTVHAALARVQADIRMRNFRSDHFAFQRRHGERVLDPAVRVEHVREGEVIAHAVDRVADQIERRQQHASAEEEGRCEAVVQSEYGIVDVGLVTGVADADETGQTSQQADQTHCLRNESSRKINPEISTTDHFF